MENLYSSSWEFEDNIWTIHSDGCIEVKNNSGKVLAINGEEVILEDKVEKSSSQLWIKGSKNSEGYFSLKNKETGKFLTVFTYTCKCSTERFVTKVLYKVWETLKKKLHGVSTFWADQAVLGSIEKKKLGRL